MEFLELLEGKQSKYGRGIMVETIQPLFDLGYLTHEDYHKFIENGNFQGIGLIGAISLFRADYEKIQTNSLRYSFYDMNDYKIYESKLNNIEVGFLHNLVSLDNEFQIPELPVPGELNLLSRVIHYRLNLFGVLHCDEDSYYAAKPFSEESICAIQKIRSFLRTDCTDLELCRALGNMTDLTNKLIKNSHTTNLKFAFFRETETPGMTNIDFENNFKTGYSDFLIRFYQIHLWMHGFYQGKIDGDFAEMSHKSTRELIRLVNKKTERKYRISNFLRHRKQDYFCLNVVDLIQKTPLLESDQFENFAQIFSGLDKKNKADVEELFDNEKDIEIIADLNEEIYKNLKAGRRVYFGIKSILKTAFETLKRFFTKIFKKWISAVKSVFSHFFREVRESLTIFIHGMKFLLSSRVISTSESANPGIVSDFDLDFDVMIASSALYTEKVIRKHGEKCTNMAKSLKVSLLLSGILIRTLLVIITGPVGWFRFLTELLRIYRNLINSEVLKLYTV